MKELSIEEKARAYDNVREKIAIRFGSKVAKEIFSEYEEPEDEKIRKWLTHYFKEVCDNVSEKEKKGILAWLEKQGEQKHTEEYNITGIGSKHAQGKLGEMIKNLKPINKVLDQKPTDKVESKFKVGDWVVYDHRTYQIVELPQGRLINANLLRNGKTEQAPLPYCEKWSINYAKDGDVLAAHECLVLFREIDGLNIRCYCTYHFMNNPSFYVDTLQNKEAFLPATKEQCDLLFQKMKEAGYIFDFEKKELKKIEQKPLSEEDIATISRVISIVKWAAYSDHSHPILNDKGATELVEQLESLKDRLQTQSNWKPSDEQMDALRYVTNFDYGGHKAILVSLYEQLKNYK